ncbi:hypothetical protein ACIBHX_47515 [Nonomuraea sp. NPDC050536]|uniref:hypothetical protein n=1 Tax=Nonomuraea sp. NPDC050536 TaxID=3364366 RepID=UPI0037C8E68E
MTTTKLQIPAPLLEANSWLGFLADDEWVVPRGDSELSRVEALLNSGPDDIPKLFVGANLLALLLFRQRNVADARRVCQKEISFALRRSGADTFYALQPQINLIRLEGFVGSVSDALSQLAELEQLSVGRPARFSHLDVDEDMIDSMREAGHLVEVLARSVRVVDTCKILWRRGAHGELVSEAERLTRIWPELARGAGPQHAAETPWLVHPLTQPRLFVENLSTQPLPLRQLNFIRLLHTASALTASGDLSAGGSLAEQLFVCRSMVNGRYLSTMTPLRCLASLSDTLLRAGRLELALTALQQSIDAARDLGDHQLLQDLSLRRAAVINTPAADAPVLESHISEQDLARVTALAMSRFEEE